MIITAIIDTEANEIEVTCEEKDCCVILDNANTILVRDIIKECEEMPDIEEEENEPDWIYIAVTIIDDDEFLNRHPDWIPDYSNGKDDIDDLVENHKDWLEEEYNKHKELYREE